MSFIWLVFWIQSKTFLTNFKFSLFFILHVCWVLYNAFVPAVYIIFKNIVCFSSICLLWCSVSGQPSLLPSSFNKPVRHSGIPTFLSSNSEYALPTTLLDSSLFGQNGGWWAYRDLNFWSRSLKILPMPIIWKFFDSIDRCM